jgi:hypothetical protein
MMKAQKGEYKRKPHLLQAHRGGDTLADRNKIDEGTLTI